MKLKNLFNIFLMLVFMVVQGTKTFSNNFSENSTNSSNNDLIDGIRFFYDNFFFLYCKTNIIVSATRNNYDNWIKDLKNSLLSNHENKVNYIFSIENHNNIKAESHMSRDAITVLMDTYESFATFKKSLTEECFNLHGYYLFVLIKGLWNEQEMKNFTTTLWTKGIINFNIIYENSTFINFTSIEPFSSHSCFDLSLKPLNVFKNGNFQKDTRSILFPKGEF